MSRLDQILQAKRAEIESLRPQLPELRRQALMRNDFRSLRSALRRADGQIAVIAEVKKASPSAGVIAQSFAPMAIARQYEADGADGISVLTDAPFFHGKLEDLVAVRGAVARPVLRKDFILDEIQIVQSVAAGADAILLIVAALDQSTLVHLRAAAEKYQVDAIVEAHTLEETERALDAGAEIVGLNNRDLDTFTVDLSVTEKLSEEVPENIILVSESGIRTAADVARLTACGIDAILVGEALMRGQVTMQTLRSL
jgi:indole-3-glycerol phosphate synthase